MAENPFGDVNAGFMAWTMIRRSVANLALASLVGIHLFLGALVAFKTPFPTKIDEDHHFSYARHIAETGHLWPDFRQIRVVEANDPRQWSDQTTHLTHPSAYYIILSSLAGDAQHFPLESVTRMRLVGLVVSALAMIVALTFGLLAFEDPLERFIFAAVLTLCPIANVLAGMINNDNMALLAGALAFLGLIDAAQCGTRPRAAALIALGLALAGLTKLTALIGLSLVVGIVHLLPFASIPSWRRNAVTYVAILAVGAAVGAAPSVANLARYGALLYAHPTATIIDRSAAPLSPLAFFRVAADRLLVSWPGFPPIDPVERWTLPALIVLMIVGAALAARQLRQMDRPSPTASISVATVSAAVILFTVNSAYLFRVRGGIGGEVGVYFRYYLPLWPGLAVAATLGLRTFGGAWRVAAGIALFFVLLYGSVGQLAVRSIS